MPAARDPRTIQGSLTVLVVEDELLIAMDIEEMLTECGWTVLGAGSTRAALRLLESTRPDVALLDVNLNGELVTPVAHALHDLDVPFVVSSAYGRTELNYIDVLAKAPQLEKPAPRQRLVAALREAALRH